MEEENIKPEEIRIEIIQKDHHLDSFHSYEQELVDFLRDDALENQQQNLSVTFLWLYRQQLVAYITLLTDKITLEGDLREYFKEKGIHYQSLPALKIGRLCVDDRFRRRGLGRLMIQFAVHTAKEINQEKAGCRFITVDAKRNPQPELDSAYFYRKLRFKNLEEQSTKKITFMYLDLKLV